MSASDHAITFNVDVVSTYKRKNTWADWHIVPATRPLFAPPTPKYQFTDIPGADGGIDFTNVLGTRVPYNYREGSNEFIVMNGYGEWQDRYSEIMNFLQGKNMKIMLDDDPGYYYIGRSSVNEWRSEKDWSRIVIDYHLRPYKMERTSSLQDWLWDALNFETGVIREYKDIRVFNEKTLIIPGTTLPVVPTFIVKGGSVEVPVETVDPVTTIFDWQTLGTTNYPSGFKQGWYGVVDGAYYNVPYTESSTSICTAQLYRFDDYDSFSITRTQSTTIWVTEYDSTKAFVATYGNENAIETPIIVEITKGHYYGFTFSGGFYQGGDTEIYMPMIAASTSVIKRFANTDTYKVGDYVVQDGDIYLCVKNITIPGNFFTAKGSHGYTEPWLKMRISDGTDLAGTTYMGKFKLGLTGTVKSDNPTQAVVTTPTNPDKALVIEMLALRIWAGMYGYADERKVNIESLGYDYTEVQAKVDELSVYFGYNSYLSYDYAALNTKLYNAGMDPKQVGWSECDVPTLGVSANIITQSQASSGGSGTVRYNWQNLKTAKWPTGFQPGWYDPVDGSSHRYLYNNSLNTYSYPDTIMSNDFIYRSNDYVSMTITPPDGYYVWVCKYGNFNNFIKLYSSFEVFSETKSYKAGDFVIYKDPSGQQQPLLYKFQTSHTGAWVRYKVIAVDGSIVKAPRKPVMIPLEGDAGYRYTFTFGAFHEKSEESAKKQELVDQFVLETTLPTQTVWKSGLNVTYQNKTYFLSIGQNRIPDILIGENSIDAPWFKTKATYKVGDYVTYNDKLYRCLENVTEWGYFNPSQWTEATELEAALKFTGNGTVSVDYRGGIL